MPRLALVDLERYVPGGDGDLCCVECQRALRKEGQLGQEDCHALNLGGDVSLGLVPSSRESVENGLVRSRDLAGCFRCRIADHEVQFAQNFILKKSELLTGQ